MKASELQRLADQCRDRHVQAENGIYLYLGIILQHLADETKEKEEFRRLQLRADNQLM